MACRAAAFDVEKHYRKTGSVNVGDVS